MHVHELALLMTTLRHLADGTPEEVPEEARDRLRSLLENYDQQVGRLTDHPVPADDVPEQGPGSG